MTLADFHAPASMIWSREALIGYLYGQGVETREVGGKRIAVPTTASHLLGETAFPAGLFTDNRNEELSAVIFSNACAISKLSRVGISAGAETNGLRYTRIGNFFDRTPGALKGIPFCLDIIPTVIDQNPCAHLRMPRDMIFHGWSMRLFQAWQHSATMSS